MVYTVCIVASIKKCVPGKDLTPGDLKNVGRLC